MAHRIVLSCQKNMRSLQGYRSMDGRVIQPGLYRSGNLMRLTEDDMFCLQDLHIRDIFDLRSQEEVDIDPTPSIKGIRNHHVSALRTVDGLENFYFFQLLHEHSTKEDILRVSSFVRDGYEILPFHNPAFRKVFDCMLQSEDGTLFHCSSGKDRTGVLAALILKLLDVEDAVIFQDYLLSNQYIMQQTVAHLKELNFSKEAYETALYVCTVHSEFLKRTYDAILTQYKDFKSFFKEEYELDREKIMFLQNKYLK